MAEVQRKRTLVNGARHRKRNPKKMTAKQIRFFGTKRQRAALKNSHKRKRRKNVARRKAPRRNAAPRRLRATRRATRPKRRRRARRRNPGGIVEVALNPAPKRRKMARTRKRRKNRSTSRRRNYRRRRRTNPTPVTHRRRRRRSTGRRRTNRRHARRNPSMGGVSNLIVSAAYAIGGAVGSKYLTQMVLGASNVGYVGYAANIAAAFVAGKAVGMFTHNKQAESSVILGGVIMAVIRFLSDQTPLGTTLSQYGLGDYEASTWLSPARYVNGATSAVVDLPTALMPKAIPAGKGGMAGMRGLGSGSYSRARGTY